MQLLCGGGGWRQERAACTAAAWRLAGFTRRQEFAGIEKSAGGLPGASEERYARREEAAHALQEAALLATGGKVGSPSSLPLAFATLSSSIALR